MKPMQSKVFVHIDHVNVYINGGGTGGAQETAPAKQRGVQQAILNPHTQSIFRLPADTPIVYQADGINYIEARGGSLSSEGSYPNLIWAKAFPQTNVSPLAQANWEPPDDGSAVSVLPAGDGTWAFLRGSDPGPGNSIPGAAFDNTPGNPPNSSLLVWYEYDGDEIEYTVESANFHGYIPPGSKSPTSCAVPAHVAARTLVASFTGALAVLGRVNLVWNGVSWTGLSSLNGGSVLTLTQNDQTYQLHSSGPGTSYVVAGKMKSFRPFSWEATGTAVGNVHGNFKVHITE